MILIYFSSSCIPCFLRSSKVANVLLQNVDKLLQIDPNTIYELNVGAR